jgi:FixJ family two-component response regulator
MEVNSFSSANEFMNDISIDSPSCLVLDVRMPGISGLQLQEELNRLGHLIPIIFISGYGNVPMSVQALKKGAVDFLLKPYDDQDLLDVVQEAINKHKQLRRNEKELFNIKKKIATLTDREKEVMSLVVTGIPNKQIAFKLGVTLATAKAHRGRVMEKMRAESLAHLVRMVDKLGIGKVV